MFFTFGVAGLKPVTQEPWANDAIRFTDATVEKRGDYTDAGEVELQRMIQHVRNHGRAPPDIQSKLYDESSEYQDAVLHIRRERQATHGSFAL